jgi:hypothetical protein
LLVARIAWACDINAKEGWKYPDYDYTKGFNVQPNWFPFKLKAREGREYLVEQVHEKIWGTRGFEVFSTPPLQLSAGRAKKAGRMHRHGVSGEIMHRILRTALCICV